MSLLSFYQNRWLLRQRLGPADVYPQEPKQKEDELTSVNVKQGFINQPPFNEEYSSAHLYTIDANKINQSFNQILTQKQVVTTFNDAGAGKRLKPQVYKEQFWLVPVINAKCRVHLQTWFKDLIRGTSLLNLCRRVPVFSKKDDLFRTLSEYEVPMVRATWVIKITSAYHLTQTDAKIKKRAANDPNLEWTQAICKFMREHLVKLNNDNNNPPNSNSSMNLSSGIETVCSVMNSQTMLTREDIEVMLKYISCLAHHMYSEGLFDRNEFLSWVVDEFECISLYDEIALSYFVPILQNYIEEVTMNQLLARRMSFAAARHLSWLFIEGANSRSQSPALQSGNNTPGTSTPQLTRPTSVQLKQQCPEHLLSIAHTLACVIQCTVITCPGALVWYQPFDAKASGSPLDLLPCAPSDLPLPDIPKWDTEALETDRLTRLLLQEQEGDIVRRSRASEMKWSTDKCQESTTGHTINRVLSALEALDKQHFDRRPADSWGDPLDLLYHKIFDQGHGKDGDNQLTKSSEDAVIGLLCEWAISPKRLGEHRAAVVAKLLELRQSHHEQVEYPDTTIETDTSLNTSVGGVINTSAPINNYQPNNHSNNVPYFQNLLFTFLDQQAPELKNPKDGEETQSFKNLVLLFSELIEHDVFSHDIYMNTLISRGEISPGDIGPLPSFNTGSVDGQVDSNQHLSNIPNFNNKQMEVKMEEEDPRCPDVGSMDFLTSNESVFSPGECRSDRHFLDAVRTSMENTNKSSANFDASDGSYSNIWGHGQPRHVQYLMHFPISFQEDGMTQEWNQRLMVLYGAGRLKTEVKRAVRKVTRHLNKLVQCKRTMDDGVDTNPALTPSGKKMKKSPKSSHIELLSRYRVLSYFDQHMVTSTVAKSLLTAINNYIAGRSSCLPRLEVVLLLFDLMEEALNVGGLVRTAVAIATRLADLANEIQRRKAETNSLNVEYVWYTTELSLAVVSVLRHYISFLTLNMDLTFNAFEGLLDATKQSCISNPTQCASADRSVLVFLYDLYTSFGYIRSQRSEAFGGYVASVRQALCSTKKPATTNCRYDQTFLQSFIDDPMAQSPLSVAEKYSGLLQDVSRRYSFVCSAVITVCNGHQDFEKVNALAVLCAEMNARCNELSSEWLGVLRALCFSSCTVNFNDVLLIVEAGDAQIRDPLSLFTAVLIARGCLSLEDVIQHVAIPSLLAACKNRTSADLPNPDTSARLTCHLLLQLFKAPSSNKSSFRLPFSSDRHLLAAAQHSIAVGAVLAVLKGVLKLGDARLSSGKNAFSHESELCVTSFLKPIGNLDDFDDLHMTGAQDIKNRKSGASSSMDGASLSEFAKHAVRVICSQQWVREKCLKDPVMDLLMDQVLTREQRQNLIQLICYPENLLQVKLSGLSNEPRKYVVSVLSGMTRWTFRQCLLELQVMLRQSPQEKSLPEHIAKATIEVFQQQQQQQNLDSTKERKSSLTGPELDRCNVWLVAPLVSKLPSQVQGRVLQEASAILEAPQNLSSTSTRSGAGARSERDNRQGGTSLLNHQPFLTLILTCLKGQDEQRDSLLESLQSQIVMLHSEWQDARSHRGSCKDVNNSQNCVHDALQLRLSLVGGMFDTVMSNSQWTSDVVVLLMQLIISGMVDVQTNSELFDVVYDMIAVLLHHTLGGDCANKGEGSKREYINIVKKMKKEMGDKQTESIRRLRQLLPITRPEVYVVCCEPSGAHMDIKGNKIPVPVDGNQGLQVTSKQKLNMWDVIEGLKHSSPLCLAWFGARTIERKPMFYEEQHNLMLHHQHSRKRDLMDFLSPPQLPPEEEEEAELIPVPTKIPDHKGSVLKNPFGVSSASTEGMKRPPPKKKKKSRVRTSSEQNLPVPYRQTFSVAPNPVPAGSLLNQMGTTSTQVNSFQHPNNFPNNPPNYPNYQQTNQQITSTYGANNFPPSAQQAQAQSTHFKDRTRQALQLKLLSRHPAQGKTNTGHMGTQGYSDISKSVIRQRLEGHVRTSSHVPSHDMYSNQPQSRQVGLQQHMINQGSVGYNSYNTPTPAMQQNQHGIMQGYNNSGYRNTNPPNSQIGYQQTTNTSAQSNQQFMNQQQNTNSAYGVSGIHPNSQQTAYSNPQQVTSGMGMIGMGGQTGQPNQYGMTSMQRGTSQPTHMTRMNQQQVHMSGTNVHQMNTGQSMQGTMNQRQVMGHQSVMNPQQQYSTLRLNTQPQSNQLIDMRRNIHQQGPPPY
ncbi:mediator of RNA polymerase II transcription subunit 12-like protein isoform X1 [Ciona intestinalis]